MTGAAFAEAVAELHDRRLEDMASFVIAYSWRPADYWEMTLAERDAIISERRRQNRKNNT